MIDVRDKENKMEAITVNKMEGRGSEMLTINYTSGSLCYYNTYKTLVNYFNKTTCF